MANTTYPMTVTPPVDRDFVVAVQEQESAFTEETRFAWLLEFCQREDLLTLAADELADIHRKIVAFAISSDAVATGVWWEKKTSQQLHALAQALKDGIHRFTDNRGWRAPVKGQRFLYKNRAGRFDERTKEIVYGEPQETLETDLNTLIFWKAMNLLRDQNERIQTCAREGCGRWFARTRRQLFCSETCANRVHIARWRSNAENRKSVNEQRRDAYAKAVNKKIANQLGRPEADIRVKVGRRGK